MMGYWERPEETARAVIDGWMHTGDGGYMDEDGFVYVVDRVKDMIISGGENVYSVEVENALAQHPAVAQCAVIGIPDERWGETVHAVVVIQKRRPGVGRRADRILQDADRWLQMPAQRPPRNQRDRWNCGHAKLDEGVGAAPERGQHHQQRQFDAKGRLARACVSRRCLYHGRADAPRATGSKVVHGRLI